MGNGVKYSCKEYREEMQLLGLKRRLKDRDLTPEEKRSIIRQIEALECDMGMN
jgi:hypothetical protein